MIFGIKSPTVQKRNLIRNSSATKFYENQNKSYCDENTYFHDEQMAKVSSTYFCLTVIFIDFVLKKDQNFIHNCF